MKIVAETKIHDIAGFKMRSMRRADRFSKLTVAGAKKLIDENSIHISENDENFAIIVATQYGPHEITFSFMDDLVDYSDAEASPTKFSHTVHNAAASYVAVAIGTRGPTSTVTKFDAPLREAMILAKCWLNEERASRVLIAFVDCYSEPMNYISDNVELPSYSKQGLVEGAYFALLENSADDFDFDKYLVSPLSDK